MLGYVGPLRRTSTIRHEPLLCPMFEHRLLLEVMGVVLLVLVHVARSVRWSRLLGCVLGFTVGRLRRMRTMSRGRCGCVSLPLSALGTMVGILCVVGVVADCEGECNCFLVVGLLWSTLTKRGQRGLTLGCCISVWFRLSNAGWCCVVVDVMPCVVICSESAKSFSVVFVGVGVCVWWVVVVPVKSLSARLSSGRVLVSVVGKGRWFPRVCPARLVLKGGGSSADDVEERGLCFVASMVGTLRASLIATCRL